MIKIPLNLAHFWKYSGNPGSLNFDLGDYESKETSPAGRQVLGLIFSSVKTSFIQPKRTNVYFTITAEIHARSLANFYCQYADRHMNLKFMRHVSEREPAIPQFIIVKNKLMSAFNASVLLLIVNFVDPQLL